MYITVAVLAAIAGMIIQGCFIAVEHKEKFVPAVILKGSASVMFLIVGIIGIAAPAIGGVVAAANAGAFEKKIVIGLAFGVLGDVFLNLRFVFEKIGQKIFLGGIFFFLIGHILYLAALIPMTDSFLICFIIGAVLAAGLLIYIFKTMEVKLSFKIFGVVYLGAVIIMTVTAIVIAIGTGTVQSIVYAVGAVLFTASDIVLIFNTFSGVTRFPLRITNLSLYYIGQILIAGSLLFI